MEKQLAVSETIKLPSLFRKKLEKKTLLCQEKFMIGPSSYRWKMYHCDLWSSMNLIKRAVVKVPNPSFSGTHRCFPNYTDNAANQPKSANVVKLEDRNKASPLQSMGQALLFSFRWKFIHFFKKMECYQSLFSLFSDTLLSRSHPNLLLNQYLRIWNASRLNVSRRHL